MKLSDGIRRHGFRQWHERELLASHGWLIVAVVGGFFAFFAFEAALANDQLAFQAMNITFALLAGAGTVWCLRRFGNSMLRAQRLSEQAGCKQCGTFGLLAIVAEDRERSWARVRCRHCNHEWPIEDP